MAVLNETLSLAEKAGLDQYTLLEVLSLSDVACPLMKAKGQAVLKVSFHCGRNEINVIVMTMI